MATKAKARIAVKAPVKAAIVAAPLNDPWVTPPASMEERLTRIEVLGERIEEHIKFMEAVPKLNGTSMEAKEKAVAVFYDRLFLLEQELATIQENLRLG